ncbi:MAG: CDP-diacylglycerol--glycerol-3-phosphate 3-phosphatidyltransferase [Actinomycetaceae bacterium]|nr:CDP-diacylglycerol--glycerol-3-phosphate 3-phosphatidyltransferase [Arcanobacterium sp.]MDD7687333.1 CDP-diacylglycerol--glycerol-3-phosphate 3-phosphatidyltransferase [Actinomycetaceae bacterium]MDY5274102.1 CDP-diacylglycerol--glycerol-3-phosphate 3-phosphatidyltransferase [Arcanobacterium sp.]
MALTTKNDAGESVPLLNLPNVLTIIRLVLVPVFIALYWVDTPERRWWAFAVFVLAALTDKLDGYFARARSLITDFGKLADSIADKALIIAALVLLSWHGLLWWWVTALFIVRELGITWLKMALKNRKVIAAGWHGKIKMVLQSVGIAILLVPWETIFGDSVEYMSDAWSPVVHGCYNVGWVCLAVALVFAFTSAWGYVREGIRLVRETPAEQER